VKNLSLRIKLILPDAVNVLFTLALILLLVTAGFSVTRRFEAVVDTHLPIVTALEQLKATGAQIVGSGNALLLDVVLPDADDAEDTALEEAQRARTQSAYTEALTHYLELNARRDDTPAGQALTQAVEAAGEELLAAAIAAAAIDEGAPDPINAARVQLEAADSLFAASVEAALARERLLLIEGQNGVRNASARISVLAAVMLAGGLFFGLITRLNVGRTLLLPIDELKHTVDRLRQGDLSARSTLTTGDELGQFAATFNQMAEAIETRTRETDEARAQAERSDKVKSAFLASMSHELRTPLNAVINFTRFVIDGDTGPVNEQQAELLTQVVDSSKHLLTLINDVLDMSKIEAGSLNLFVEDNINLNVILDNVITTGRALINGKPVRLNTDINALPLMIGDQQRITQILLNIISNACKFTEEGEITLRARHSDDEVLISVRDTGPGIAPEDQALVFEAFRQTRTSLRQAGGTGLGMPIARSLAEAHGGRLWLESAPGEGSTFYVALPIHSKTLVVA
jgi:signal transduction histidine kinase